VFYKACADADPNTCALHEATGAEVKSRTEAIFAELKTRPIPISPPANSSSSSDVELDAGILQYGVVDYSMTRNIVFHFLYTPYGSQAGRMNATSLAYALAAAGVGDGRPLWELSQSLKGKEFECECGKEKEPETAMGAGVEQLLAVACSDGDEVNDSVEELQKHYEGMAEMSSFAELWTIRLQCA
jgi:hypothetical protein